MNAFLVAFVAVSLPLVLGYDEKYDKIDVDKIIADEALFTAYTDCMLDKGPCDVEYAEDFKKLFPEVVSTVCGKCSPIQKDNVRKTVKALAVKRPAEFEAFRKMYDPERKMEAAFIAFVLSK